METFINRYIAQGEQGGRATTLLHLIAGKIGLPTEPIREKITQADPDTLLLWLDRAIDVRKLEEI